MDKLPPDHFVTTQAFTKKTHRDVYSAIDPTNPANSQAGKVVAITGVTRGVGRKGFVQVFAKANPKAIILIGRSSKTLEPVKEEVHKINPNIDVVLGVADMSDSEAIRDVWTEVKQKYGHADVFVANAGILEMGAITQTSPMDWWSQMETNLKGTFLHIQNYLSILPSSVNGTIVAVVTALLYDINPGLSSHSLSKLGIMQLLAFVSAEHPNVLAVGVHPGIVHTDMTLDIFRRFALDSPELIAGMAVWLASKGTKGEAAYLKGRYLSANWDVEELEQRKDEIEKEGLLKVGVVGKFGQTS